MLQTKRTHRDKRRDLCQFSHCASPKVLDPLCNYRAVWKSVKRSPISLIYRDVIQNNCKSRSTVKVDGVRVLNFLHRVTFLGP